MTTTTSQSAKPSKLAWRLLLSVIIIYCLSFAHNFIEFIISLIHVSTASLSHPNIEGYTISRPFAAIFYFFLITGLLNRVPAIRILAFIQIGFQLIVFGSLMFGAFSNETIKMSFDIFAGLYLDLDKLGIIILSACMIPLQLYKTYILLRKDVSLLFASPQKQSPDSA